MAYMENECGCAVSFDAAPLIRYCPRHAAAPALLEALEHAALWIADCDDTKYSATLAKARAAIAQARGEGHD